MNPILRIHKNDRELAEFIASILVEANASLSNGQFYSVALSGGSTPRRIFDNLAKYHKDHINWNKIQFFWGDERCVPPDDEESNYKMTKDHLLDMVPVPKENVFRIHGENDPVQEAIRYEDQVKKLLGKEKNRPIFDLVLLGIGDDGHTASIFPPDIQLFDSEKWFVATKNPYSGQNRISATGQVINYAKRTIILATGEGKAEIISHIISKKDGCEKYPVSKVQPVNGQVEWVMDEAASSSVAK